MKSRLQKAAVDLGPKGKDSIFGAGALDFGVLLGDKKAAKSISISTSSLKLSFNKTVKFDPKRVNVTVLPIDATDKSYSVKIANTGLVSFDGLAYTGKAAGTTAATYKLSNAKASTKLSISVTARKFWIDSAAKGYASGDGSQSNPYIIKTAAQLAKIAKDSKDLKLKPNAYYRLGANIDLNGKTWFPILARDKEKSVCRINFDGDGYTISNLQIQNINSGMFIYYAGLFGSNAGEMKNINLIKVNIDCPGSNFAGGICADSSGYIHNCSVQGKIISKCSGGIAGTHQPTGNTDSSMGIYCCKADVTLSTVDVGGGIVGLMTTGTIANCVSISKAKNGKSGGIIGNGLNDFDGKQEDNKLKIYNCVSTTSIAYELISETKNNIVVRNCAYGADFKLCAASKTNVSAKNCIKATDSQIKTASFYKTADNWFDGYSWNVGKNWSVKNDYPVLINQHQKPVKTDFEYYEFEKFVQVNGYNGTSKSVTIPTKINGKSVSRLGNKFLFKRVKPTKLTLPSTVKRVPAWLLIDDSAKSIEQLVLGKNTEIVEKFAFGWLDRLEYIEFPAKVKFIGECVAIGTNKKIIYFNGDKPEMDKKAFYKTDAVFYADKAAKNWKNVKINKKAVKIHNSSVPLKVDVYPDFKIGYKKTATLPVAVYPLKFKATDLTYKVVGTKGIKQVKNNSFKCTQKGADGYIAIYYKGKKMAEVNVWQYK